MKVSELFEAYEPPVRNPKLGFRNKGEKVGTGKEGIPIGGTKEWLKTFGATETDVAQALRVVRQSPEYRAVKALGMEDQSGDRHNKNGSITFVGFVKVPRAQGYGGPRDRRMKITVQANGKMDETNANDFHRYPLTSPKPRIVPGDAVSSIVKTMTASLEKLARTVERRQAQAAVALKKFEKEQKVK